MYPQLPIDVDSKTGVWSTNGLPMLYVPRHFFVNNHKALEAVLGRESFAEILYVAGYRSAHFWCESESRTHGLVGVAVFEHYLNRLSQRGWGLFSFIDVEPATGNALIRLDHSAFVLAQETAEEGSTPDKVCFMFAGWFAGAMDWVGHNMGFSYSTVSREIGCAGEGHAHCTFRVEPK
jgi:hypothetical protein